VEPNPLLDVFPNITLLDHGFTVELLRTDTTLQANFLDPTVVQRLENTFDVVLSFDTLEHVADPFTFCRNLVTIAVAGGHIYVQTVFSWEYHPSPRDYFRYSPEGLEQCFANVPATVSQSGWITPGVSTFVLLRKHS
jgi:hypothetical protein